MSSSIYPRFFVRKPEAATLTEFLIPEDAKPDQSYPLFAALADERNGFGVTPIAEPRHLPEEWRKEGDAFFKYANYLTLEEMLAYDWFSPEWHQLRLTIGDSYPLHEFTQHFREETLPAMQAHAGEGEVLMAFCID